LAASAWRHVEANQSRAALESFIREFGDSKFARLARVKLATMDASSGQSSIASSPSPLPKRTNKHPESNQNQIDADKLGPILTGHKLESNSIRLDTKWEGNSTLKVLQFSWINYGNAISMTCKSSAGSNTLHVDNRMNLSGYCYSDSHNAYSFEISGVFPSVVFKGLGADKEFGRFVQY